MKANQPKLFEAVCLGVDSTTPVETVVSRDNGRSRAEDRTVEVFPASSALAATEWNSCVKTIIRVTRRTLLRSAVTGLWNERGEVAYYVSSASDFPATVWAAAIRGHWGIENRNHYVRDVTLDEDKSRIRDNPGIMARARSFALNIMRRNGVTNVAEALWNGALSLEHILAYKEI